MHECIKCQVHFYTVRNYRNFNGKGSQKCFSKKILTGMWPYYIRPKNLTGHLM